MRDALQRRLMLLLVALLLCSGCAFGHKYNYHEVVPNLKAEGSGQMRVATHDQRPYVVSRETVPQFVGLTRGGYGNPFNVRTQSDRPLAEDMTHVICNALSKKGFQCVPVVVASSESTDEVRRKLQGVAGNVALLLTLREWKSDTYSSTALIYDVALQVLDGSGTVIAETSAKGRDVLGSSLWNPIGIAHTAVPQAFKQKLEELLNHPAVLAAGIGPQPPSQQAALPRTPAPGAAPPPAAASPVQPSRPAVLAPPVDALHWSRGGATRRWHSRCRRPARFGPSGNRELTSASRYRDWQRLPCSQRISRPALRLLCDRGRRRLRRVSVSSSSGDG